MLGGEPAASHARPDLRLSYLSRPPDARSVSCGNFDPRSTIFLDSTGVEPGHGDPVMKVVLTGIEIDGIADCRAHQLESARGRSQ